LNKRDFFIIPYLQDAAITGSGLVVNLLAQDLGASPFQLGLLGLAWGLSYAVGCMLAGRWADRHDRRGLLMAGGALFTATLWLYQGCSNPWQILALNFLNGLACALFWPVFETLLHDEADEENTRQRMGYFNLGWTCGIASGMASGGYLKEWGTHPALNLLAGLTLANLLYLAWRIRDLAGAAPSAEETSSARDDGTPSAWRVGFLYMAWVANFGLWFSGAAASQLFPKLARELSFADRTIGLLLSLVTVAQGLSFLALARTDRWHYRFGPLVIFQLVSVVGLGFLIGSRSWSGFAAGLGLLGIGRGMSYSASLYYALVASPERGLRTGIHEMLIGAAFVLGPFLGGGATAIQAHWLPLAVALRAPFELGATVLLGSLFVETLLWRRYIVREKEG
jgi:MFS family permease